MHYHTIGGGWLDTTQDGESYLRVSFGYAVTVHRTYTMMKNKKKNKQNSPDYLIYETCADEKPKYPNNPQGDSFLG